MSEPIYCADCGLSWIGPHRCDAALDRRVVELLESIADGVFAHHTRDSIREQCRELLAEMKEAGRG